LPLATSDFTEFLKISVTDSGIGISPAGMATLFRPFSQIDSSLSRGFAGTGLGLALVKQLVELHGGAVAVQSEVATGSCFSVWLPHRTLERVHPPSAPIEDEPSTFQMAASTTTPTALVVEADIGARELLRQQLEAEGFHVVHADSAEAAVALAEVHPLALITLDINLPNMNGWEFLSHLKQTPALAHIPVVVVSIAPDHSKGVALGAAAVIHKPLARRELQDALVAIGMFPRTLALKVLIVEDDPADMELIATRIKSLGGTVLRAAGALAALQLAHQEHPDLIVLDLVMPEVNGFEVVEALRQRIETSKIPILVITAQEIADGERQRLSGVVTTVMQKSDFGVAMFVTEVRRAISGRQLVL
jgi:CheY-like chemotaxis protein